MQILTCPAKLQRLEAALRRSLPLALPVYGAVMNINRGNPGAVEVVVDSWPDFGAVLARPSGEVAGGGDVGHCVRGAVGVSNWRHWEVLVEGIGGHWGKPFVKWGLPPGVQVGSLTMAHVELLNETWPYGGTAHSRGYLAELLSTFPSLCLQDEAAHPVCWVLNDHFGTGAHGYTLRAHRRRGHMQAALAISARRAHARGFFSYG
ncbi:GLYL3 protein, partial [Crotophaga sulcirostris]|nr:GLYL3 protein [Crotophaga sulcirostris]